VQRKQGRLQARFQRNLNWKNLQHQTFSVAWALTLTCALLQQHKECSVQV
jgi:hypothetical protein